MTLSAEPNLQSSLVLDARISAIVAKGP